MVLVVALGPNDVQVPCLMFATDANARDFLIGKGLVVDTLDERIEVNWEDDDPRWDAFFTDHYFGCGGVWAFKVITPTLGVPFLGFDLG